MPYVYSTKTNSTVYVGNATTAKGKPAKYGYRVLIKGGAGLADKKTLATPLGVATQVTEEELALLKTNKQFLRHQERGFLSIGKSETAADKVAADMAQRDNSAPLVEQDFAEDKAPTTSGKKTAKKGS